MIQKGYKTNLQIATDITVKIELMIIPLGLN